MSDFHVQEWEVWHTYATYLDCPGLDLLSGASKLVESEVAECVVSSTGRTFWRSSERVAQGITSVSVNPQTGAGSFKLVADDKSVETPKGFALEAWGQAALFIIGELRVLGEHSFADEYIRAYLGKIVVTAIEGDESTSELNLYPVLVIYQSGVLILELRMIGPFGPIPLSDFIQYAVNLPRLKLSKALVNPGLARNATAAYYRSTRVPLLRRYRTHGHKSCTMRRLRSSQRRSRMRHSPSVFHLGVGNVIRFAL